MWIRNDKWEFCQFVPVKALFHFCRHALRIPFGVVEKCFVWFNCLFVANVTPSWVINCDIFRSMNKGNTSSAWTKTAWCTPQSLWLNPAPTLCGRSSLCGCIAPSAAGPTPGSPGRPQTYIVFQHNLKSVLSVLPTFSFFLWHFHSSKFSSLILLNPL